MKRNQRLAPLSRQRQRKFWGWRLLRSVLLVYSVIALYLFFFADRMVFFPPAVSYEHSPDRDKTAIMLAAKDGNQLAARYLHNPDSRYTILFSHGNATDIGGVMPVLVALRDAGFSVLAYDYPGYGYSTGSPTERNAYIAADAAYAYLVGMLEIAPAEIIVQGQSVGGGPSTYLAANKPVAGLILESSFATAFQVVVPFRILPFEKFPNIKRIDKIGCPLLLIHGTDDSVIPFNHSEDLLAAAQQPKMLVPIPQADHNDVLWVGADTYVRSIQDFALGLGQ